MPEEGTVSEKRKKGGVCRNQKFDTSPVIPGTDTTSKPRASSQIRSITASTVTFSKVSASTPSTHNANRTPDKSATCNKRGMTGAIPKLSTDKSVTRRMPAVKRRKVSFSDVLAAVLIFLYKKRKTVITVAVCLICLGIAIPLIVGAANIKEAADFNLINKSIDDKSVMSVDVDSLSNFIINGNSENETKAPEESAPAESEPEGTGDAGATGDGLTEEDPTGNENSAPVVPDESGTTAPIIDDPKPIVTYTVTIGFYDRESITCTIGTPTTLWEILDLSGYTLRESDRPTVALDTVIDCDSWIMIDTVEYKEETVSTPIPYTSETVEVQTIPKGTYQTVVAGQNGSSDKVYTVEYVNGVEVSRTMQYEYISAYPVNEVNYYGIGGVLYAPNGQVYNYSYYTTVRATYYNLPGNTYTGLPVGDNIVATDPAVFPLGTRMYVMNGTLDMGERLAADIGGGVKGNLIDLWMNENSPNFEVFAPVGLWEMTAYILE